MFDQTFVDGVARTNKSYTVVLSTVLQISAVCLLILVPLFYTQTLPNAQLRSILIAPRPPAPPVIGMKAENRHAAVTRTLQLTKLFAPTTIPKQVAMISEAPAAPDIGVPSSAGDGASTGNPVLFSSAGPAVAPPPAPSVAPKKPRGPVRVGGVVAEANIIHRVQPAYPPLAKSARIQGTVEFTAVISKEGRVEHLQLVNGHPLLVNAARDAILEWRYRPTMLNGGPVEVLTTITVNFRLSQ